VEHRPLLAAESRPVQVADIERACLLSRRVGLLAAATAVAGGLLRESGRGRRWFDRGAR
jgi:adenosylcobinamide-phosphate synthase